jgi:hypothetical protein
MMMRRVLAITVLLLGLSGAVHADILATGAMYGGSTQTLAACYLFNAGTGTVTVTSNQIIREAATNLALATDNCNVLAPATSCRIATNIVSNLAHSCRFIISPSAADVRGVMEIRAGNTVLQNSDLR